MQRIWIAMMLALGLMASPAIAAPDGAKTAIATAASPDKTITLALSLDPDGRINYSLTRKGKALINPSRLGFLLTDGYALVRDFQLVSQATANGDDQWEQPWGERRYVRDHYSELLVTFRQTSTERMMSVRFRLFDNGVGFRYEIPAQAGLAHLNIAEEMTEFDVARAGTAFWQPGGEANRYEYLYNKTPINAVSTAQTPMTLRLNDGTHLSFHEAALIDYASMWLKREQGQTFRSMLSPSSHGPKVSRDLPFASPWRTIRIADGPKGLVENDLELNLNAPNVLGDVAWVKPFKYIGIWWEMFLGHSTWSTTSTHGPTHGATTANAKTYIDFAAKHHIPRVLIEGWNKGWDGQWYGFGKDINLTEATPDFDLKAVTDYARRKGVHLIGHHETGGNVAMYESQMESAMALYERLGVDAIKTGYVADAGGIYAPTDTPGGIAMEWHDGQFMSRHHLRVLETAARHHIAINTHEPIKDTGLRRTYPNWVSREGARGMEYNASTFWQNPPSHEPTLVFTRMLAGPMDYTPGILSLEGAHRDPLPSTLARQLALYVAIYSPIQMIADVPAQLAKYPRELGFIAQVPVDWAESHLIDGAVGDYAVLARKDRNSADWYIGGITDEHDRKLTLAFDFLDAGKTYLATIYRDGDDADYRTDTRHHIVIETRKVTRGDTLAIRLAAGGGMAIRLHPSR